MHVIECIASKPGLFFQKKIEFGNEITVIYGENKSGKSLIAKAIIDTLWGEFSDSFSLNGNVWENMRIELLLSNSSNQYRFIKDCKDSFTVTFFDSSETPALQEKEILKNNYNNNDKSKTPASMLIKLHELTNDSDTSALFTKIDIDSFMNISYMPSPVEFIKDGKLNYSIFQKLLLDDSSNFYSLYENMTDDFQAFNMKHGIKNTLTNDIIKVENELKKIDKKIQIFNIQISKSQRLIKEKTRLENELEIHNKELSHIRDQKTKLSNISNNLKHIDALKKEVEKQINMKKDEQSKIDDTIAISEEIITKYPQFYEFNESNIKNLKKIQETYTEVRDIYEIIENYNFLRNEKKNKFKNIILYINIFSIIILVALIGISAFVFTIQLLEVYKIKFIAGLLALSISSSFLFLIYNLFIFKSKKLKRILNKKISIEEKLEKILKENKIILSEYKLESIYEFLSKYFDEYGEYSIRQTELLNIKNSIKPKKYLKEIEDQLKQLKEEEEIIKNEINNNFSLLDDIKNQNSESINEEIINKHIFNLNHQIKNLKENIDQNKKIIQLIAAEIEEIKDHTNEIESLNKEENVTLDKLNKLKANKISIEYIAKLMGTAIVIREEKQLTQLAKNAEENFHFLTNNQYIKKISDEEIKQIIIGKENNEDNNISISHIQILSIKLAISSLLNKFNMNLPFIIDEPFQQMDDQRIKRFKKLLDDISSHRQVIIFTHNNKRNDWGKYIEL